MASWFEELKRRRVFRVVAAYLVAAWLLLQIADVLNSILDLPDWAPRLVFYLVAIGLVPTVIVSWAYQWTPGGIRRETGDAPDDAPEPRASIRPVAVTGTVVTLAALVGAGLWFAGGDERWARNEALPELEVHIGTDKWEAAYATALDINARLPGSDLLDDYWSRFATPATIASQPEGATVYRRPYDDPDAEWQMLGQTPLYGEQIPRGFSVVRVELEGYDPLVRVIGDMPVDGPVIPLAAEEHSTGTMYIVPAIDMALDPATGEEPRDDVRVPGTTVEIDGQDIAIEAFRIGRHEVTNAQFLEFVEAGGYQKQQFWEHEFVLDGEAISWEDAMARMTDSTGQPGPSTWIGGTYPPDQPDYPVSGISWYEAQAFARFAKRDLPTLHHWRRAHADAILSWQLPASNIEADAVVPVGSRPSLGWTGTYDMLGNVREWCANALGDQRSIVGGAWDTLSYMVQESISSTGALPPFDRSPRNGMRLATLNDTRAARDALHAPVTPPPPIVITEPASDEAFEAILRNFQQGNTPLEPTIDEEAEVRSWTRQHISFDRGDGTRSALYLYLPKYDGERLRTVAFWPSSIVFEFDDPGDSIQLEFMLRRGWAVAIPVLERTYYRRDRTSTPLDLLTFRDVMIRRVREFRRMIDYLETRPDLDTDALVFYGLSWGGIWAPVALVAEPRLKVGILNQAGYFDGYPYDIDPAHYLGRVHQPVLQFNGRYDTNFRYEDMARPFFDMLGSEHKKHVVEPTGHFAPMSVVIGETLSWIDTHLLDDS